MGYNQPLALGLAIGIPCFLVLVACTILVFRHRRVQKREDKEHDDVELDNESFKGFEQALHQPQTKEADSAAVKSDSAHRYESTDKTSSLNSHTQNSRSHSRETFVEETPFGSESSAASRTGVNRGHNKSGSVYDFYDSFIPFTQGNKPEFQPPALSDRQSIHSHPSLIAANSDRSLDSLAKQLHGHVFSEKFPTQRGVSSPRRMSSNANLEERPDQSTVESSPKAHPYRAKAVEGKPALSLQDNFDNNITADAEFGETAGVIFK